MDLGCLQRFLEGKRRQDGRHALGQHSFSGAGRADHQDVVASGTGNFDGPLRGLLAADVLEVDEELLRFAQQGITIGFHGKNSVAGIDEVDHIHQRAHRIDLNAAHHRRFFGVGFRHHHA